MHHVVALIAERQGGTCTNRHLSQLLGVSLEAASLFQRGRGKAIYMLLSSNPTLALLLVEFTEYDDDYDKSALSENRMI
ncbi:hypothetical protein HanPI659440_Chr14g0570501 [Helianthus annuus]|nr:hypothetical protein HanPI659440_Chr14g0570501 [Helianthus annuus]